MAMRRVPGVLLVMGLFLASPVAASAGDVQATRAAPSAEAELRADFNGDGAADLAVAAPGESLGAGQASAGVVQVLYGSSGGLTATGSQLWSQDTAGVAGVAEARDGFGGALATGDFNADGRADLAVGVPSENATAPMVFGTGVVHVLYGSAAGLTTTGSQLWSQDSPGVAGVAEAGDGFGGALAAGDFNADGRGELAVGAFGENQGRGVVHVLAGSASGLTATGSQLWSQGSGGVAGIAEVGDSFGFALATGTINAGGHADLAIERAQALLQNPDTAPVARSLLVQAHLARNDPALAERVLQDAVAAANALAAPLSIYEVHLGSWRRDDPARLPTYRGIAQPLADYLTEQLGIPVESFVPNDYTGLIAAMEAGQADIGAFGPFSLLQAQDEAVRLRTSAEEEHRGRRAEIQRQEKRLQQKEENLDRKLEANEKREKTLQVRERELEAEQTKIMSLQEEQRKELERVAGMTAEQAKEVLLAEIEDEVRVDASRRYREIENEVKEEADERIKKVLSVAAARAASASS